MVGCGVGGWTRLWLPQPFSCFWKRPTHSRQVWLEHSPAHSSLQNVFTSIKSLQCRILFPESTPGKARDPRMGPVTRCVAGWWQSTGRKRIYQGLSERALCFLILLWGRFKSLVPVSPNPCIGWSDYFLRFVGLTDLLRESRKKLPEVCSASKKNPPCDPPSPPSIVWF